MKRSLCQLPPSLLTRGLSQTTETQPGLPRLYPPHPGQVAHTIVWEWGREKVWLFLDQSPPHGAWVFL